MQFYVHLSSISTSPPDLFVAEGDDGFDAGGLGSGNPAAKEGDGQKEEGGTDEAEWVAGLEAVKHGLNEADEGEDEGKAGNDAEEGEPGGFAKDHGPDLSALRAESEADADLVGALGDGIGHDAVNADAGE